jgi:hypothetical protein
MLIHEATSPLGQFDCSALATRLAALDETVWHQDDRRQQDYDVHAQTQSLIVMFCSGWPDIVVTRASGYDLLGDVALPLARTIIDARYKPHGHLLRAMFARLPPGARIPKHRDIHPTFAVAHRIHVPIVTNSRVEFVVGQESVSPRAGHAFELNNHLLHHVTNRGDTARIHFIFDYAPAFDPGQAQYRVIDA